MANLDEVQKSQFSGRMNHKIGNTNRPLYEYNKQKGSLVYYLPAYCQVRFNSINKMDFKNLKADVNCEVDITLNVAYFPNELIDHIKKNFTIILSKQASIKMPRLSDQLSAEKIETEESKKKKQNKSKKSKPEPESQSDEEDEIESEVFIDEQFDYVNGEIKNHYLTFSIRQVFLASMMPRVGCTPFELINLILSINPKVNDTYKLTQLIKCKKHYEKKAIPKGNGTDKNINIHELQYAKTWLTRVPKQIESILDQLEKKNIEIRQKNEKDKKRQKQKEVKVKFSFNAMAYKSTKKKPASADEIDFEGSDDFGNYSLAPSLFKAQYSSQSVPQQISEASKEINKSNKGEEEQLMAKNNDSIKAFEYCHLTITIYKKPINALVTIFLPLVLLSIVNLGIFFQPLFDVGGRIENTVVLILAFVFMIDYVRSQLPVYSRPTLTEWLIYALTLTNISCISYTVYQRQNVFQKFDDIISMWLFISSVALAGAMVVIILVLTIIHYAYWQKKYRGKAKAKRSDKLDHTQWRNEDCDMNFLRLLDKKTVKYSLRSDRSKINKRLR